MGLIINILITLIGLTILIVALFNYIPQIEKLLEEKLNISLSRGSKDHGILSQIFYKYNHRDVNAWSDWIMTQGQNHRIKAIEMLIEHLESVPANWGAVTPEAIKALSKFENREHITILRTMLSLAKKSWKKYKITSACYEEALKAIISINEDSAIKVLSDELGKKISSGNEEKTMCIINALESFSEEADIGDLFTQILTNTDENLKTRNHAINTAQRISDDKSHKVFFASVKKFLEELSGPFAGDDIQVYDAIFNLVTKTIDEETFQLILQACNHEHLASTSIYVLELVLKGNHDQFTPAQLYTLINLEKDHKDKIGNALASSYGLSANEKEVIKYEDPLDTYKFEKAPIVESHIDTATAIEVPKIISEYYEKLMAILKDRAVKKQTGSPGGVLITGFTDQEKILLTRAVAVEKRWSFVFGIYDDLINSGSNAKNFIDTVTRNKPCLVYLDEVGGLLVNKLDSFTKYVKQMGAETSVFLIGSMKEEAEINENGCSKLIAGDEELESIFPKAFEITKCNDGFKNKILQNKLSMLDNTRGVETWEQFEILKNTVDMSPLELEKYLAQYFRASLLVHGKLIHADEFDKLSKIKIEGQDEPQTTKETKTKPEAKTKAKAKN